MTFQSFHFLIFFCVVFFLNLLLTRHFNARKLMLVAASYYFYMCWDWRFATVLAGITAVNYFAARRIARTEDARTRKAWLVTALAFSLGVLAFFKYANFFLESSIALARTLQLSVNLPLLSIVQPVGVSFFTFQALSYTLDVYRNQQEPASSPLDYTLFVSFFPTLLSGPITRAKDFLGQLKRMESGEAPHPDACEGLMLVVRGLLKKVLFADLLALHLVNPAFDAPANYSSGFLLVALYGYTLQIYMDLSGYTDIARGVAKMLGFDLPKNFERPYLSTSVSNFWQRWHISMSSFFRDYLFFGLGGSRYGNVYRNLMLTFIAIGAWHGAGWRFILYGALHGGMVCIERTQRGASDAQSPAQTSPLVWVMRVALTFHFVVMTRLLFRADDLPAAGTYAQAMLFGHGTSAPWAISTILALVLAGLLHLVPSRVSEASIRRLSRFAPALQGGIVVVTLIALLVFSVGEVPFIYFDF